MDHGDHDILRRLVGLQVRDQRVLKVMGRRRRAGGWEAGRVSKPTGQGTPQGGPLSPLLANSYLEVRDKERERRGLSFSRYADDCNISVGSEKAAQRVLERRVGILPSDGQAQTAAGAGRVDTPA